MVDRSAIAAELGVTATPAAEALAETSATYLVVAARLPGNG